MDSTGIMANISFNVTNLNELVEAAAKILHPLNALFANGSFCSSPDQLYYVSEEFEDLGKIFSSCMFYCKNFLQKKSNNETAATEVQHRLPEVSVIETSSDSARSYDSFIVERHEAGAKHVKEKKNDNTYTDQLRKYVLENEQELISLRKRKAALEKTLIGQLYTNEDITSKPAKEPTWNRHKNTFPTTFQTNETSQGHYLDEIYSEAALFISQNETRPRFVIDIFKILQGLDDTIHCENCLQQISNLFVDHFHPFTSKHHCLHEDGTFSSGQIVSDQSLDSINFEMPHLELVGKSIHATCCQCISQVLGWMSNDENISAFSDCKIRMVCLNLLMDAVQNCQDVMIQGIKYIPTQSFLAKFEISLHENLTRVWKKHVKELLSLISETVLSEFSTTFHEKLADDGTTDSDCDQGEIVPDENVSLSDHEIPDFKQNQAKDVTNHLEDECQQQEAVIIDLSASETKPLTSYGSGEDEDDGSGEEYHVSEVDIATSMQHNTC
uniref:Pericentriolar material 1 protein n=1 Tax=Phallusia mammillata TaxID=59560 RepID=A0A6F9DNZ9_9ASCI|nr:pericentriolar material 1 protein [Phallusia mammillata]